MLICQNCHTGRVHWRTVPYIQWQDKDAIIVDRIPALVCDSCGDKAYDPQALENLQRLLWSDVPHLPHHPQRGQNKS